MPLAISPVETSQGGREEERGLRSFGSALWTAIRLLTKLSFQMHAAGSLFLFDRTQLRSFRRDNHVWKRKPDGKAIQETHEKIKVRMSACTPMGTSMLQNTNAAKHNAAKY